MLMIEYWIAKQHLCLIIHMKNCLDSDWLRAVQFLVKDPVLPIMPCALENNRRLAPVKTKTTTEAREA